MKKLALIYKGKTELIHNYHRSKVTDKTAFAQKLPEKYQYPYLSIAYNFPIF